MQQVNKGDGSSRIHEFPHPFDYFSGTRRKLRSILYATSITFEYKSLCRIPGNRLLNHNKAAGAVLFNLVDKSGVSYGCCNSDKIKRLADPDSNF